MTRKVLLIVTVTSIVLTVWFYSTPFQIAHSQGEMEVQCGQILERDFTGDMQEHIYMLPVDPRWSFDVSVEPFGDDLETVIALYGPTDILIDVTDGGGDSLSGSFTVSQSPTISSGVLSARGS